MPRSIQTSFSPRRQGVAQPETQPESDSGERISLSLQSILNNLPGELQCRVAQNVPDYVEVSFSRDKILSQLASGCVKFSFGELRLVSPHGTLMPQNDRDHMPIELPLAEVLARVSPTSLPRRDNQRRIIVPDEIAGPFGNQCQGITIAAKPARPAPAAPPVRTPQADEAIPLPQRGLPGLVAPTPASGPVPPAKSWPTHVPAPKIAGAPTVRLQSHTTSISARRVASQPHANNGNNGNNGGASTSFTKRSQRPIIKIVAPPKASEASTPFAPAPQARTPRAAPEKIPFTPTPSTPPQPVASPTPVPFSKPTARPQPVLPSVALSGSIITMAVADLWESWPDSVKDEITQLGLAESKLAVPLELVEAALKQGKVAFSWRLLSSWIKPAVRFNAVSPHEGAILDLPLKVVAPAFLSRHRGDAERKRVELAGDIPDLWSGGKPASEDTTVARPKTTVSDQTNYYVWSEENDSPVLDSADSGSVPAGRPVADESETRFTSRFTPPTEVVKKAASIQGVAGALVALEDGLLVASSLTPDVNGETLAAFIPQTFIRVSQTTKELMMGELNNLNFTLGTTPWKIFRIGSLFFAVYGRPGEPLPTARIAGLAAELERKPR